MQFEEIPVYPVSIPAMRAVEIMSAEIEGQPVLVIRDPSGVIDGTPVLQPHPLLLLFIQMADGLTGFEEMSRTVEDATGQAVAPTVFESIAEQLDEALLLQSERFRAALIKKRDAFLAAPVRPGMVYRFDEADRLEGLRILGDEFRRHNAGEGSPTGQLDLPEKSVIGIIAPHIDYARGGRGYAWAYRALADHGAGASTYIVLGTNHHPASHRFIATRKNFETPLGEVETDAETLNKLAAAYGGELFRDEYAHASEHTIELQALYLKQTFAVSTPKIVPILVSSFEEMLSDGASPRDHLEVAAFCAALRKVLQESDGRVALIGSVDLSHCGPQFGDDELNESERCDEIEARDRKVMSAIEAGDPDRFFEVFREDQNATKVCSIATIYCVLEAMRGVAKPRVLSYQQANSEDQACLVSFCSVAFVKNA